MLAGLRDLLRSTGGVDVVAACRDGAEALSVARSHRLDVLILDLRMPAVDGLGVLRALSEDPARPRCILLTAEVEGSEAERARALGVDALILKESALDQLVDCIITLHEGRRWGASTPPPPPLAQLAPVTREAAVLFANGSTARQVATRLDLTELRVRAISGELAAALGVDRDEASIRDVCARIFGTRGHDSEQAQWLQERYGFTRREASVAALLSDGLTNREIAEQLGISLNTVKTHISNIHAKTDVTTTRRLLAVLSDSRESDR